MLPVLFYNYYEGIFFVFSAALVFEGTLSLVKLCVIQVLKCYQIILYNHYQ
jgi:hypothetical protein